MCCRPPVVVRRAPLPDRPGDHRNRLGRRHRRGQGEGVGKNTEYLPEAHTDMIFAVISKEETSLIGVTLVICAFAASPRSRGFGSRCAARVPFGKLLAAGITALRLGRPRSTSPPRSASLRSPESCARWSPTAGRASWSSSPRWAFSLTSPAHGGSSRLRCVLAGGRAAGPRRPALAVAEALRARGVAVTFAGSPDRVESRLVPEAGSAARYVRGSGFPRRIGMGLVRSLSQAARAAVRVWPDPRAETARRRARRRRLRRRTDGARRAPTGRPGAHGGRRAPRARKSSRGDYVLLPSTDAFGSALAAADLAISRAGGTVWELAAAGTPSILVPYPHATADHQTLNARHFDGAAAPSSSTRADSGASRRSSRELLAGRRAARAYERRRCSRSRGRTPQTVVADGSVALAGSRP